MLGRGDVHGSARPYLSVVVPAYNEAARILPTLERLREYFEGQPYRWSVTVVSDGSTDGTDTLAMDFARANQLFAVVAYTPNRGKGYAVRRGMLTADGDLILFTDADLAAPIEELEKLLKHIDRVPVAIGSRPLAESWLERRQPLYRELLGRLGNKLIQLLGVPGIYDTQCGFKLFRRAAAREIFRRVKLKGYSFDFESLMIARDLGLEVVEVPIRWAHQEGSKVALWRDAPRAVIDLLWLRLIGRRGRLRPLVD
jgi:dolichyl-phosphate beta-glucosyltransferase